jgi:hypothetical protein
MAQSKNDRGFKAILKQQLVLGGVLGLVDMTRFAGVTIVCEGWKQPGAVAFPGVGANEG